MLCPSILILLGPRYWLAVPVSRHWPFQGSRICAKHCSQRFGRGSSRIHPPDREVKSSRLLCISWEQNSCSQHMKIRIYSYYVFTFVFTVVFTSYGYYYDFGSWYTNSDDEMLTSPFGSLGCEVCGVSLRPIQPCLTNNICGCSQIRIQTLYKKAPLCVLCTSPLRHRHPS